MKKTIVIHQPDFLPHISFFHRLLFADLFVILDDVQFIKGTSKSWMNRDKLKNESGETWLTVSVKKSTYHTNINDVLINHSTPWVKKNIQLIQHCYRKSPYYDEIFPYIEKLYLNRQERLADFNLESIKMLLNLFDIKITWIKSSDLITSQTKSERLVEILSQVNATHYLSGIGAKSYHDDAPFIKRNITVLWQNFNHPLYPQLFGDFIPYLSSLDILFNCGIKHSQDIIRSI